MSSPFLLRVHGRSGHASMPAIADNALVKAAPLVERLGAFAAEPQLIPEVEGSCQALLGDGAGRGRRAGCGARRLAARRRADRAAARHDRLADDGARLREAQRDPGALRDHGRPRLLPGQTPGRRRGGAPRLARRGRLRPGQHRAPGRHTLARSAGRSGTRSQSFVAAEEPGAHRRADLRRRLHRLALAARRRSAPSPTASSRRGRWTPETAARLIHSADERVPVDRPRARRALAASRGADRLRCCSSCTSRRAHSRRSRQYLAERAADGARRRPLPRLRAVRAAAPRALRRHRPSRARCRCSRPGSARRALVPVRHKRRSGSASGSRPGRRRLRGGDRGGARGDRARRRLPGEPRAAPLRAVRGRPGRRSRRRSRRSARCIRGRSPATAGRSSPPRPSSSSRAAATGSGRCRSRARARSARTSTTRRTRPST